MKRNRLRRMLKWTGTAIIALVFLAALSTIWWSVLARYARAGILVIGGSAAIGWTFEAQFGLTARSQSPMSWLYYGGWPKRLPNLRPSDVGFSIPLWMPFIAVGAPTAWLWRLDRRRPAPGACKCGYDLTGNTSGRCPECGQLVEKIG